MHRNIYEKENILCELRLIAVNMFYCQRVIAFKKK